jgi:hypothetical protein
MGVRAAILNRRIGSTDENDGVLMFDPAVLLLSLVAGLAYMVYPYFVETALTMIVVGTVLAVGLWLAVREGW